MTQQDDPIQKALEYMRYQGAKTFDDIIALIDRTSGDWSRALEGMSEEQAGVQPVGEWNAKEVLSHLLTSNRGINQQIADMAGAESPRPAKKITKMGESSMSLDELRGVVTEVFNETKSLISLLRDSDKLDQKFPHPLFGPLNLKEWFAFHRVHAMDHIQQLDKIKADPAYAGAG
jgi:hypothetical protein